MILEYPMSTISCRRCHKTA